MVGEPAVLMSVVEIGRASGELGESGGVGLLAAETGATGSEFVGGTDVRTCRSNVELDEVDCDLATWLCLSKGDSVNTFVWTSEGAGGPSLTWKVTTGGGLCAYLLSTTTSEGRPG